MPIAVDKGREKRSRQGIDDVCRVGQESVQQFSGSMCLCAKRREWNNYGGLQSGFNGTTVRLYAPTYHRFGRGALINLGVGAGGVYDEAGEFLGEKNVQRSHTAEVRFQVSELPAADFDSGWFYTEAQRAASSFHEIYHGLKGYPARVKVMTKAVDGQNAGFLFEGRGDGQKYRWYSRYGTSCMTSS